MKIDNCTFSENSGSSGGVIKIESEAVATITSSTFHSNFGIEGGVFAIESQARISVSDSNFTENSALSVPLAYISDSPFEQDFRDLKVTDNSISQVDF